MKIDLHTPQGIVVIDSDTVSDAELAQFNISRARLKEITPRDFAKELDDMQKEIGKIKAKLLMT